MTEKRHALIIASYQYQDPDLRQLIAPAQDAEGLARVLQDSAIGGFQVQTLQNERSYKVNQAIEAFFADRKTDDLLLLYYSGHGIKDEDGRLYFATTDTRRTMLRSTAIPTTLVNDVMPTWAVMVVLVLALVLVMSSMDTVLNGIASAATSDLARFRPGLGNVPLLRSSRAITVVQDLPAIVIASRGYSVLYLFLIADLVCAAAVFPVFWGLYVKRFGGSAALISSLVGLAIGALLFPTPEAPYVTGWTSLPYAGRMVVSFGVALGASAVISVALTGLAQWLGLGTSYDFAQLRVRVRIIGD